MYGSSSYPAGQSHTSVGGASYGPTDQLAALLGSERTYLTDEATRRRAAASAPQPRAVSTPAPVAASAPPRFSAGPAVVSAPAEDVNRLKEPEWYEYQGAATRPVGLGAQMIPGMAADPRLLPPWMRPNAANVSYAPKTPIGGEDAFGALLAAGRPESQQPEPGIAERYFKQFGHVPPVGAATRG